MASYYYKVICSFSAINNATRDNVAEHIVLDAVYHMKLQLKKKHFPYQYDQ